MTEHNDVTTACNAVSTAHNNECRERKEDCTRHKAYPTETNDECAANSDSTHIKSDMAFHTFLFLNLFLLSILIEIKATITVHSVFILFNHVSGDINVVNSINFLSFLMYMYVIHSIFVNSCLKYRF